VSDPFLHALPPAAECKVGVAVIQIGPEVRTYRVVASPDASKRWVEVRPSLLTPGQQLDRDLYLLPPPEVEVQKTVELSGTGTAAKGCRKGCGCSPTA
jgi:hypothetical protein